MSTSRHPLGRIPLLDPRPAVHGGRWPAKGFDGEVLPFSVTAFREGHDLIGVQLLLTGPDGTEQAIPARTLPEDADRWHAIARLDGVGTHSFRFRAYADDYASWVHDATVKIAADVDTELMLLIGSELFAREAKRRLRPPADKRAFTILSARLADTTLAPQARLAMACEPRIAAAAERVPLASLESFTEPLPVRVERERAGVGAWYEFFPRSEGAVQDAQGRWTSGTFATAAKRLPAIAAMGFDVVYLPPIHPIGRTNRKGRNNSLLAGPEDPGSPWAIGAAEGGHDAIHPELGTEADFTRFLSAAGRNGLEVAIDLALQASPDHPWVASHPEWFTVLPDGSIAYAENPPKKYQDIYPLNFDRDPEGIRAEILRVVEHWIGLGVRIFRVDNPHTKPVDFWEWLIATVNAAHPDVVFLAEAFTRPAMMSTLGAIGFQQSYTYFTWRNAKGELEEYLEELAHRTADMLRPNLFVNTPDILTEYLQTGGRGAFLVRAAIAATAAPSWGMYSGFELMEHVPRPGAEEYIDNEKYEYRPRDWKRAEQAGASIAPYIAQLNAIRRAHPALRQLRNLSRQYSEDDAILVYGKSLPAHLCPEGKADTIVVVANLDPHSVRETMIHLDLAALGLRPGAELRATELLTGAVWTWGEHNYVRLDAPWQPAHIVSLEEIGSEGMA